MPIIMAFTRTCIMKFKTHIITPFHLTKGIWCNSGMCFQGNAFPFTVPSFYRHTCSEMWQNYTLCILYAER